MNDHLSPEELVDAAESARDEAALPHLVSCERCRQQLHDVRSAMQAAASADVPEPSPLFWDHLSARVASAIASPDAAPRRFAPLGGWRWQHIIVPLCVAGLVVAAVAVFETDYAFRPRVAERLVESAPLADDPLLDLVADVGGDVDWDSAADAGLAAREGTVDKAVMQLNDVERVELHRLLAEELKRSGD
jgi:hypothetical protein